MDLSGLEGLVEATPQPAFPSTTVGAAVPTVRTGMPILGLNLAPSLLFGRTPTNQFGQGMGASPLNLRGLQPIEAKLEAPQRSSEELQSLVRSVFEDGSIITFDNETMDKWEVPNLVCNTCQTSLPPMLHLLYRAMIRGEITDPLHLIKLVSKLGLSREDQDVLLNPEIYGMEAKLKLLRVYGLPPSELDYLVAGVISGPFALKIVKKIFGIDQICCNGQIMFPLRMVLGEAIDPGFMQRLHNQIRIISGHYDIRPIGPNFDSVMAPSVIPGIYMDTNSDNDPFVFLRQVSFYEFKKDPRYDPVTWINNNL